MGDWKPLALPPDVEERVSACISGTDAADEIIQYLNESGSAACCSKAGPDGGGGRGGGGRKQWKCTGETRTYKYYQCACGSGGPFKFRITKSKEQRGKMRVYFQGPHCSEVQSLSQENEDDDPQDAAAGTGSASAVVSATARDDDPSQRKLQQDVEEKQAVDSQGSGADQGRMAGAEGDGSHASVAGQSRMAERSQDLEVPHGQEDDGSGGRLVTSDDQPYRVEPTRIPYRPENEGIAGGMRHFLATMKICEYYEKPAEYSPLRINVWHRPGEDDSDDCCMTFREIREGVAAAFRAAQKLGDVLSNHVDSDCQRIGGDRVEYFLSK
jgi:hypothetical protein